MDCKKIVKVWAIVTIALSLTSNVAIAQQDSDRDGVLDGADKCSATPKGAAVDRNGCPKMVEINDHFETAVLFVKNSDRLHDTDHDNITKVARFTQSHRDHFVLVEGFQSEAESVDGLANKRAKRVAQLLVSAGVARSKIRIAKPGDHTPEVEGDTAAAHAANQRVYIKATLTMTGYEQRFNPMPD